MRTYTVTVPDTVSLTTVENLIFEGLEPGSALHCRRIHWDTLGICGSTHPRLDVTVKEIR